MESIENYCFPYCNKSEIDIQQLQLNPVFFNLISTGGYKLPADKVMEDNKQVSIRRSVKVVALASLIAGESFEAQKAAEEEKTLGHELIQQILCELETFAEECAVKLGARNVARLMRRDREKYRFQSDRVLAELINFGAETNLHPKTAEMVVTQLLRPMENTDARGKIEGFYFR